MAADRVVGRIIRAVLDQAALAVHVPARRAGPALLRRDHDDAVRRVGAVERRGGRTLDDLDRLDLVRVQITDPARLAATREQGARVRVARHPDAVDDVDRIVRQVQAVVAADADARARPGLGSERHRHTGCAGGEHLLNRRHRRLGDDLGGVDVRDRVTELGAAGFPRRRRHDFLQSDGDLLQREVQRRRFASGHRYRLPLLAEADPEHAHARRARRHVAQRVATLGVCRREQRRADDDDARVGHRLRRADFRYPSCNRPLLRGGQRRRRSEQSERNRARGEPGAQPSQCHGHGVLMKGWPGGPRGSRADTSGAKRTQMV
jgi:hypothetical protein